jgi:hypothetical protein
MRACPKAWFDEIGQRCGLQHPRNYSNVLAGPLVAQITVGDYTSKWMSQLPRTGLRGLWSTDV